MNGKRANLAHGATGTRSSHRDERRGLVQSNRGSIGGRGGGGNLLPLQQGLSQRGIFHFQIAQLLLLRLVFFELRHAQADYGRLGRDGAAEAVAQGEHDRFPRGTGRQERRHG
jgi:hypothetical protein